VINIDDKEGLNSEKWFKKGLNCLDENNYEWSYEFLK